LYLVCKRLLKIKFIMLVSYGEIYSKLIKPLPKSFDPAFTFCQTRFSSRYQLRLHMRAHKIERSLYYSSGGTARLHAGLEFAWGGAGGKTIIIPLLQRFILPTSAGNLIPGACVRTYVSRRPLGRLTTCYEEEQQRSEINIKSNLKLIKVYARPRAAHCNLMLDTQRES
jgi:hypothetical protein